jgi:hypothetical protein
MAVAYNVLPILVGAAVLRLLVAERLDFALVLSLITILTGVVWGLDALCAARPPRRRGARGRPGSGAPARACDGRLRAQFFSGGARRAPAALVHLRAVPHSRPIR